MTGARARPVTGSHRTPPPRRTFSSGQRALLWAAGVLGALAILISVLLVLQLKGDKNKDKPPEPTVTQSAPTSAPASPQNWTPTLRFGQARPATNFPQTASRPPPVHDENLR